MTYTPPVDSLVDFDLEGIPYVPSTGFHFSEVNRPLPSYVPSAIAAVSAKWEVGENTNGVVFVEFGDGLNIDTSKTMNASISTVKNALPMRITSDQSPEKSKYSSLPWDKVYPQDTRVDSLHKQAPKKDLTDWSYVWDDSARPVERLIKSPFIVETPWKDIQSGYSFFSVDKYGELWRASENLLTPLYTATSDFDLLEIAWADTPGAFEFGGVFPARPSQPKDTTRTEYFGKATEHLQRSSLLWGPAGARTKTLDFTYPDYVGPIDVPGDAVEPTIRGSYIIVNVVNAKRVSDNLALHMQNVSISLDVDSWAWELTAEVVGESNLNPIKPTSGGLVDIEITLNGYTFIFMIESYSGSRKVADNRYTVRGVSRTQLLAAPYAPNRTGIYSTTINANQVVDDELLNTGFTATWDTTPSWAILGGVFGYRDQSPIGVIKTVAEAAGAVVVPSTNTDELTIQPRFKVSPWALPTEPSTVVDAYMPAALVTNIAHRWTPGTKYDSAYVSGTTAGVSVLATRAGEGGTVPAPNVFDDLVTDQTVGTERARQELCSGARSTYDITLPLPEFETAPGLVLPGMIIEFVEVDDSRWRGYVMANAITAPKTGAASLSQQVSVVRFHDYGEMP